MQSALEMMGVSILLPFSATLATLPDKCLAAEAHFDIDRTHGNIIQSSRRFFDHLGMHLVFDLISVQPNLVARYSDSFYLFILPYLAPVVSFVSVVKLKL